VEAYATLLVLMDMTDSGHSVSPTVRTFSKKKKKKKKKRILVFFLIAECPSGLSDCGILCADGSTTCRNLILEIVGDATLSYNFTIY
jgi:hypothetical protein